VVVRAHRRPVPNHLLSVDPDAIAERYPALAPLREVWARRSMLVRSWSRSRWSAWCAAT
jgi:hypothetical protein